MCLSCLSSMSGGLAVFLRCMSCMSSYLSFVWSVPMFYCILSDVRSTRDNNNGRFSLRGGDRGRGREGCCPRGLRVTSRNLTVRQKRERVGGKKRGVKEREKRERESPSYC